MLDKPSLGKSLLTTAAVTACVYFIDLAWIVATALTAIRKFHCATFRISVFSAGPGRYHGGPQSGGDPPVSRVLPSLLLSSPLPHTPPPPLSDSPSLHPQLFLPPCQPRGAASSPVLPASPSPHVRRSRYCHVDCTLPLRQIIRSFI